MSIELENDITSTTWNYLRLVVNRNDITSIVLIQEPVLVEVVELLSLNFLEKLRDLSIYNTLSVARVLAVLSEVYCHLNENLLVEKTSWLNDEIVLKQLSKLSNATLNLDFSLSIVL